MTQSASESTLSFIFEESPLHAEFPDPFADAAPLPSPETETVADGDTDTYTFRWDIEVPLVERKCGARFMKQWKRVLQAQKLTPLVSAKLPPQNARFQLCIDFAEAERVREREEEITEQLARLRRDALPISGEPAGAHPAGWQGVRLWMTYTRREVELALARKSKV